MTTEKAFEQLKLAALEVKANLIEIDENIQPTVNEINIVSSNLNILSEKLVIYKFLKSQKELSPNLNLHLKVMAQSLPKEESEVVESNHETIANNDDYTSSITKPIKRIELGINDRFRIINELFNQNSTEFNLVIDQLNTIDSQENSEMYLTELMNLYKWKREHELTNRLFQLNQKRFPLI